MKKIAWLLALSPLWVPIIALCLIVIAACIVTSPALGAFLGFLLLVAVCGAVERAKARRLDNPDEKDA